MCFLSQVLGMSKTCHTVCSMILMSFEWDAMCLHLPRCVISFQTDTVFPHLTQTGMLPCVEVILIQHVLHRNPPPPSVCSPKCSVWAHICLELWTCARKAFGIGVLLRSMYACLFDLLHMYATGIAILRLYGLLVWVWCVVMYVDYASL